LLRFSANASRSFGWFALPEETGYNLRMFQPAVLLSQAIVSLSTARWREDLLNIAIVVLLLTIALGALALFLLRRKSRDRTLIYFGIFCALYALRLLSPLPSVRIASGRSPAFWVHVSWFITCTIVVPAALFFNQVFGSSMRSFGRWVVGIYSAFAVVGIAAIFLAPATIRALVRANSILVLATFAAMGIYLLVVRHRPEFRGPISREVRVLGGGFLIWLAFILHSNLSSLGLLPGKNVEVVGFLVFVGCLGYVAAQRTLANEERLLAISKELEIARQIQACTLPQSVPRVAGLDIAARYRPMSQVAGDFYDFLLVDEKHIGVLVADVTGHGVPAALIASMLKVAFAEQFHSAADPVRVLTGLNRSLCGKFESHFVTAAYVFLDLDKGLMRYAGAGHPPLMLATRHSPTTTRLIEQNGLMLGLFPEAGYSALEIPLRSGDRCLLYTDGAFEAANAALEEFGKPRLARLLEQRSESKADRLAAEVIEEVERWSGQGGRQLQDDDITVVVLDFQAPQAGK
jgi:sigma-B regulation protein RsbU (phosphoserine phosphatase)